METDEIIQISLTFAALYFAYRAFQGLSAPARGIGGVLGDIWNGITTPFGDAYGGIANVVDRLNPFTEGEITPWI